MFFFNVGILVLLQFIYHDYLGAECSTKYIGIFNVGLADTTVQGRRNQKDRKGNPP